MLKYITYFIAVISIAAALASPASAEKVTHPKQAIMVLIENGGTVENSKEALITVMQSHQPTVCRLDAP